MYFYLKQLIDFIVAYLVEPLLFHLICISSSFMIYFAVRRDCVKLSTTEHASPEHI